MTSAIYYENVLYGADVVSQDTIAGFPWINGVDGRTSTQAGFDTGSQVVVIDLGASWGGQSVNFIGFAKHNIASSGANVEIETDSDAGFGSPVSVYDSAPVSDNVSVETISAVSIERYVRITVSGQTSPCYISDVSLGEKLAFPSGQPMGYMPPKFAYNDMVINSTSQGADLVGSIRIPKAKSCRIELKFADEVWVNANWPSFIDHLPRPFYYLWDEQNHPNDAAYVWIKKKYPQVKFGPGDYQQATIDGEGIT